MNECVLVGARGFEPPTFGYEIDLQCIHECSPLVIRHQHLEQTLAVAGVSHTLSGSEHG
jgi:hypothetical protein